MAHLPVFLYLGGSRNSVRGDVEGPGWTPCQTVQKAHQGSETKMKINKVTYEKLLRMSILMSGSDLPSRQIKGSFFKEQAE